MKNGCSLKKVTELKSFLIFWLLFHVGEISYSLSLGKKSPSPRGVQVIILKYIFSSSQMYAA